jgi:hypothetical protein
MRRRSPQEKKRLSLNKDRRNTYGANDKASRKRIPRAKAQVNRANRHRDQQIIQKALGEPDDTLDDEIEQKVLGRRRKSWRKWPDEPLGDVLRSRRERAE